VVRASGLRWDWFRGTKSSLPHPLNLIALTVVTLKCYIWCDLERCLLVKFLRPIYARVAELVDAKDLKSFGPNGPCRFDSGPGHLRCKDLPGRPVGLDGS
jgi:hypothetical protein